MIVSHSLPEQALLRPYAQSGAYTDCYLMTLPGPVHLAHFVEAFYSSSVFKFERTLLGLALGKKASDQDAAALGRAQVSQFSAWQVEERTDTQLLLRFGDTRSWFMVETAADTSRLYFGSAVLPRKVDAEGKGVFGAGFHLLGGFHHRYSRALLRSALKRLPKVQNA